ncbi:type II toxin-antitoxin system ParD family antitoxin [Prosthecobacter sp.]|uniref:type II toxin-antitoxin system ParD family antitoxin n=1 Tax=Prosthecobacter sp. TaxID=1965333 RepID=UPI0037852C11
MTIALPPALSQLVERLVHTGRYADEGEVVREALRVLEHQEFDESPALEAALLEGVHSPHRAYDASTLDRIRQAARA